MKRTVPLLAAAFACLSMGSLHAQRVATTSTETNTLTRTDSSTTLGRAEPTDRTLRPIEGDKIVPVQVHSMIQSRGGTYIQLDFGTTAPAAAMVCLSKSYIEPVPSSGGWTVSGSVERFGFSNTDVNHSIVIKDLDPDSVYWIVILLNPPPEYEIAGALPYHWVDKTLQRRVTVAISFIYVIDDSDDLTAGDLSFRFQIGHPSANFWEAGNSWDHAEKPASGDIQIHSGDGIWTGISMHATNVGDAVKVTASCQDYDSAYAGTLNTPDVYRGTGNTEWAEWNSGAWTFDIGGGTEMSPGATPAEREEFDFDLLKIVPENDHTCLEFQVWGTVQVSYE